MLNNKKTAPLTGKVNAATSGHATATSKKNATSLKAENFKLNHAENKAELLRIKLEHCEKKNAAYADFIAKDKAAAPLVGSTAAYNGLQLVVNINPERDGSTGCSHYNKLNLTRAEKGFVFPSVLFTDMPAETFKHIFEQVFVSNDADGNLLWMDSYINFNSNVHHTIAFLLEMEKKARLSFNPYDIYSELYWVNNFFEKIIKKRLFISQDEVLFQMAFREFGNLQDFANNVCKAIAMICEYYIGQPKMDMIDEYLNAHRKLLEFAIECSYYFNNLKN